MTDGKPESLSDRDSDPGTTEGPRGRGAHWGWEKMCCLKFSTCWLVTAGWTWCGDDKQVIVNVTLALL